MKEPVDHILRPSLPWRDPSDPRVTECGYDASKVKTLTRDEYAARLKELGQQRCAMLTCMTCADAMRRWCTWADDPRGALGRAIEWEYDGWRHRSKEDRGHQLHTELLAIASLIEKHHGELKALVAEIDARREWNERKDAARAKAQIKRAPTGGSL